MHARTSKPLLFLAFCLAFFFVSPWIHFPLFYLLPVLIGTILILGSRPMDGVLILMSYLCVDGAFKLFSEYNLFVRLGTDILIMATFVRLFQARLRVPTGRRIFEAPFATLFLLHLIWVAAECFNPHGLGLIPSLAGFKTYVSALLLYFIAYSALEDEEDLRVMSTIALVTVLTQIGLSLYQFKVGEPGLLAWSPLYKEPMGKAFVKALFRPFGSTNLPGGGATLIFLLTPLAFVRLFRVRAGLNFLMIALLMAGVCYVLLVSQIRSAMVKTAVASVVMFLMLSLRGHKSAMGGLWILLAAGLVLPSFLRLDDPRMEIAAKRLESLGNFGQAWDSRTQGTYDATMFIVQEEPFGLGLSRVGAGSGPFRDLIIADGQYGLMWSFADNFYKALLTEVGIPGLILFLLFMALTYGTGVVGFFTSRPPTEVVFFQAAAIVAVLASILGHLGSEGAMYQPEASVIWILIGCLVRISRKFTGSVEKGQQLSDETV